MTKKRVPKASKEILVEMYSEKFMTTYEIGEVLGVNYGVVVSWLKSYGIHVRNPSEAWLKGKVKPTKEVLVEMYIEKFMTTYEIGEKIGFDAGNIINWLKSYKVPTRTISEARLKGKVKPTKEVLVEMYINKEISTTEISETLGVSSGAVLLWLKSYDIPRRNQSEAQLIGKFKPTKEELEKMYLKKMMNTYEIAEEIGVSYVTIINWLKSYNIPTRTLSEAMNLVHEWRYTNGRIKEDTLYCDLFNNEFRERNRDFFDRTCFLCGKTEAEQIEDQNSRNKQPQKLTVHHVTYDKNTCCDDKERLFVPLCTSCHGIVGKKSNSDYWQYVFTSELYDKYNGICFFPKGMTDINEREEYKQAAIDGTIKNKCLLQS